MYNITLKPKALGVAVAILTTLPYIGAQETVQKTTVDTPRTWVATTTASPLPPPISSQFLELDKAGNLANFSGNGTSNSLSIPDTHVRPAPVITLRTPPDLSSFSAPPYPPLPADWEKNATLKNLLGTRLYGWEGCSDSDRRHIEGAYDEFQTLVHPFAFPGSIDWKDQAAKDFWGPSTGKHVVTNENRAIIEKVFINMAQVSPGFPWLSYWIHAKCPRRDKPELDPDDVCGDRETRDTCFDGSVPSPNPDNNRVEAYCNNNQPGAYDDIIFCRKFFKYPGLDQVIVNGIKNKEKNMENYDNRGRVFLHEMTHLDFFVNVPIAVSDLKLILKVQGKKEGDEAYGPMRSKILQNWRPTRGGFYTMRNADNYAWYALTRYVWKLLGGQKDDYPNHPESRGVRPLEPPKLPDGTRVTADGDVDEKEQTGKTDINLADLGSPFEEPKINSEAGWRNITSCPVPIKHRKINNLRDEENSPLAPRALDFVMADENQIDNAFGGILPTHDTEVDGGWATKSFSA